MELVQQSKQHSGGRDGARQDRAEHAVYPANPASLQDEASLPHRGSALDAAALGSGDRALDRSARGRVPWTRRIAPNHQAVRVEIAGGRVRRPLDHLPDLHRGGRSALVDFMGRFGGGRSASAEGEEQQARRRAEENRLRLQAAAHRHAAAGRRGGRVQAQNNTEELWILLNFLQPERFHDAEEFQADFGDMKVAAQLEKLHSVLKPLMLRRMKEDVEKSLKPKEETVINVEMTAMQKKFYRAVYDHNTSVLYGVWDGAEA